MRSRGTTSIEEDTDVFTRARSFALGVIAGLMIASPAAAQMPILRPAIVGGVSFYDLGEGGQLTGIAALRVAAPVSLFLIEGSLGAFRPKVGDETRTYLIPEVQAQYQLFPALVRPYLGVGIGMLNPRTDMLQILKFFRVLERAHSSAIGMSANDNVRDLEDHICVLDG